MILKKETTTDEELVFCRLERCVTFYPDNGGPPGTYCYCVDDLTPVQQ